LMLTAALTGIWSVGRAQTCQARRTLIRQQLWTPFVVVSSAVICQGTEFANARKARISCSFSPKVLWFCKVPVSQSPNSIKKLTNRVLCLEFKLLTAVVLALFNNWAWVLNFWIAVTHMPLLLLEVLKDSHGTVLALTMQSLKLLNKFWISLRSAQELISRKDRRQLSSGDCLVVKATIQPLKSTELLIATLNQCCSQYQMPQVT